MTRRYKSRVFGGPVFLGTKVLKDLQLRARVGAKSLKDLVLRAKVAALSTRDLQLRAKVGALSLKDLVLRARIAALSTRDLVLRAKVGALSLKDVRLRAIAGILSSWNLVLRARVAAQTGRDVLLRILISTPPAPISQSDGPSPLPELYLGFPQTLPLLRIPNVYQLAGTSLDIPMVASAPQVAGGILPLGSAFSLLWSAPSTATQTALSAASSSGNPVLVQFALFDGCPASGYAKVALTQSGSLWLLVVTLTQTILRNCYVVQTQFF